jgi:TolB-like protein/class 3 adenylate cyclase
MAATRRLAAILAADVAGYSRLMGEDEVGTAQALSAHRAAADPLVTRHGGRIVKTTGDGMLIEFSSVVGAVECSLALQRLAVERNAGIAGDRQMEWRIGIHIGDVLVQGDDILGDGVNIAARLEGIAEPGGICISEDAFRQVSGKVGAEFADLGEQKLKNIARPVRVYALRTEGLAGAVPANVPAAASRPPPVAASRLSIVVLPFANLSSDPEQQYFADGITEDLTTDLSRIAGVLVISRNTAFTYRNRAIDTKQIGRELGVRYVLEGSVRRSADQIRINAQLVDAEKDSQLWAERFNGNTSDLFAVQDEITRRIAVALNLELWSAEAARPSQHPDAVDYIFRAGAILMGGSPSRERYAEAIALFEHALALDPRSIDAQSGLATDLASRVIDNMTDKAAADLVRAEGLARQALAAAPNSSLAHFAKGQLLRAQLRFAEAIPEYEAALSYNPNWVHALHALARCKFFTGSIEEVIPLEEQAIRLSPRDPAIGGWHRQIGLVHLAQSRTDEAVVWLEKARHAAPAHPDIRAHLASAYALAGDTERAAAELAEARQLSADDRYSSLARLRAVEDFRALVPKVRALLEATYIAGLHKAGMPEE